MLVEQALGLGAGRVEHDLQYAGGVLGHLNNQAAQVLGVEPDLDAVLSRLDGGADDVGHLVVHLGGLGVHGLVPLAHLHGHGLRLMEHRRA